MDSMNSTHMKRRGFSLIELLVVIGLLALLATLTVIGIGHLQTHSRQQQTKLILQNLQSMFSEYDANRRIPFGAGNLSPTIISGSPAIINALSLPCPGDVTANISTNYRTGLAVQITRDVMAQMIAAGGNATSIGKMPTGSLMTFAAPYPTASNPWAYTKQYNVYDVVYFPINYTYLRTQIYVDGAGRLLQDGQPDFSTAALPTYTINAPPNTYFWLPALPVPSATTPLPTPVLLDAWGNPIIFVMGGVLGAPSTSTSGFLYAGGNQFQVHSPDYHPFFASAGPDGNFANGDDNLYSYEK